MGVVSIGAHDRRAVHLERLEKISNQYENMRLSGRLYLANPALVPGKAITITTKTTSQR